jgi:hypothetical protein
VEPRRYLQAGAYAAAVFTFPGQLADPISFYETDLMSNYSEAVILEGDNRVVANLADPRDAGRKKAVGRVRRTIRQRRMAPNPGHASTPTVVTCGHHSHTVASAG